jgi:hypothetical protein
VLLADDPLFWAAAQQEDLSWMQSWFPVAVMNCAAVRLIASKIDFIHGAAAMGLPLPRFHIGAFTGFHGISAIDWVRHPETGRLLLIEVNCNRTAIFTLRLSFYPSRFTRHLVKCKL